MANGIADLQGLLNKSIQEEYDIPRLLREGLTKKFSNQPLLQERERRLTDLFSAPGVAEEQYAAPRDVSIGMPGDSPLANVSDVYLPPTTQNRLVQQRTASALAPVVTLNDIIGAQLGGIENIVGETRKLYESKRKGRESQLQTGIDLEKLRIQSEKAQLPSASDKARINKLSDVINTGNIALIKIQQAKQKVGGGGPRGVSLFGLRNILPEGWGGYGKNTRELVTSLGEANTYFTDFAGKALTKPEKEAFAIPKPSDDPALLEARLAAMENIIRLKLQQAAAGTLSFTPTLEELYGQLGNQESEWEIIE